MKDDLATKPLLVLVGPTAVGKTAYSIELAKILGGEIISGDSMQVYRGMDIGTAKITPCEMQGIPHHLLNICDPSETFNAARFKTLAVEAIDGICSRGHTPMVVGGTGLYVNGLVYDFQFHDTRQDPNLRAALEERLQKEGGQALLTELAAKDPETASRLFPADHHRIIRALEIIARTGERPSQNRDQLRRYRSPYRLCIIGLHVERQAMYERINQRVDEMLEAGLVEEVWGLLTNGVSPASTAMQGIGYKEIIDHIKGHITLEEAADRIRLHSRRFAKRQLTWFRRDPNIRWFNVNLQKPEKNVQDMAFYANSILQPPLK